MSEYGDQRMASPMGSQDNQTVNLQPVRIQPGVQGVEPLVVEPGQVIALHEGEVAFAVPAPGPPLDVAVMEQQLIDSGVDETTRQAVMEKVVAAQIQFLAHQLSAITWFLREGGDASDETYIQTPIRLKTVAYDHGHMEVTFRMGAPDVAPEGSESLSAPSGPATPDPPGDQEAGGLSVEEPRDGTEGG